MEPTLLAPPQYSAVQLPPTASSAELDGRACAAGASMVCCGVRIGLRANDPGVLRQLQGSLPPNWRVLRSPGVDHLYSIWTGSRAEVGGPAAHVLYRDSQILARTFDLGDLLANAEQALHLDVAWSAPRHLFIHAGVVEWQGRAIVIPGSSMTGKTTLVTALVQAGATYYSDSYAVLNRLGAVRPYAKRLSVRGRDDDIETRCSIVELGGRAGTATMPVGLVVVAAYQPDAVWEPRPLTSGQGMLALLAHTFTAHMRPRFALTTLHRALSSAVVVASHRGEAQAMAEHILELSTMSYISTGLLNRRVS